MIIPWEQLPAATLDNLIESFVLREGTDYGEQTFTLAEKVEHVRQQLQRGDAVVLYSDCMSQSLSCRKTLCNRVAMLHKF